MIYSPLTISSLINPSIAFIAFSLSSKILGVATCQLPLGSWRFTIINKSIFLPTSIVKRKIEGFFYRIYLIGARTPNLPSYRQLFQVGEPPKSYLVFSATFSGSGTCSVTGAAIALIAFALSKSICSGSLAPASTRFSALKL